MAADILSKLGSKRVLVPASIFFQDLHKPSIRLLSDPEMSHSDIPGSRDVLMTEAEDDWRLDFIAYIVEKHVRHSTNYVIISTELYRRSASNRVEDHVWFEDWWMVASLCDE
jgi:hypothetical protein